MSRGFVKETDQEEIPVVPPRADLPEGVTNFVTQAGMNELLAEKEQLINEKESLTGSQENEERIAVNHINAKLQLLHHRITSAKIVELNSQPRDEIRFGAHITFKSSAAKKLQKYQIVGVDEADISKGKVSFISPIARVLMNKKVGDKAILKIGKEERTLEIKEISY